MTAQESYWEKKADRYMSDPWSEYIANDPDYAAWLASPNARNGAADDGSDMDEEWF